ncbi:uncharacterized protein (TIGR00730 family) [Enterococcus sp. PF1-24]|uniref:LOG family protein n=1 Tax=unclassified Enterococcus TaxID=2608891 RepID=UPI002474E231|nr:MULTISPECIES: TIGR00730 family Rossman fold protein [unclassified Enterococcus]MDH6365528.1 uncharacterized protein (TIGR00730 family) [Enterococcus sp. PFB1-1]MDH6402629.1 uncharacterized protein (TIGR00730 family) [Enterococcus sp. PF1-24]
MNIAVYCGASSGNQEIFKEATIELGKWLAKNHHNLIYGGGKAGLMGILADTVLENGGEVIGIIPTFLKERELAHPALTELKIVDSMAERKQAMLDLANACIALPGGPGTLEEITEVVSWSRIGKNPNPCIFFNSGNYYRPLEAMYDQMVENDFLVKNDREKFLFSESLEEIEGFIKNYQPPVIRQY